MSIIVNDYKEVLEALPEEEQRQLGQWIADQVRSLEEKLRNLETLSPEETEAVVQDILALLPGSPIIQPLLTIRRRIGVKCRGPMAHEPKSHGSKSEEITDIDWLTKWIVNNVIIYFDTPKRKQ